MLTSVLLKTPHGFFTRHEDQDFILRTVGAAKLITLKQVHSNIVHYVTEEGQYEGDALVTDKPALALGIITADCVPVLLYDKEAKVIGAIHAGWKGARSGIVGNTVKLMQANGAKNIVAGLGPCIHQGSYEVDAGFHENFIYESKENHVFFMTAKRYGYFMFNLPGYVEKKLKESGVEKIDVLNEDTLSQPKKFCSYRRSTLLGEPTAGRQLSAICLSS